MKPNVFAVVAIATLLSSCGFTVPVAVISSNGEVNRNCGGVWWNFRRSRQA